MQLKDLTPTERTRKQYKVCKTIATRLQSLANTGQNAKYFDLQEQLNDELRAILHSTSMQWSALTKVQIMHILSLCSTHRPIALHSILIAVSLQHDKMIQK